MPLFTFVGRFIEYLSRRTCNTRILVVIKDWKWFLTVNTGNLIMKGMGGIAILYFLTISYLPSLSDIFCCIFIHFFGFFRDQIFSHVFIKFLTLRRLCAFFRFNVELMFTEYATYIIIKWF